MDKSSPMSPDDASSADESTSTSLLEGLRNRDEEAWERLVEIWTPLVYGYCRRRGFAAEDADDVTQGVLVRVYKGLPRFERDGVGRRFRFWVSAIVRNEIADFCRKRGDGPRAIGGSDCRTILENLPAVDDEDSRDWCDPAMILSRALDVIQHDFQPQNWNAFRLVVFEKMSSQEAAEQLGMSPGSVRQATFRIRKRLKETLDGLLD